MLDLQTDTTWLLNPGSTTSTCKFDFLSKNNVITIPAEPLPRGVKAQAFQDFYQFESKIYSQGYLSHISLATGVVQRISEECERRFERAELLGELGRIAATRVSSSAWVMAVRPIYHFLLCLAKLFLRLTKLRLAASLFGHRLQAQDHDAMSCKLLADNVVVIRDSQICMQ